MPTNLIQVGPGNTKSPDNTSSIARGGNQNETMVSELHGRFYEQTYRGNVYRSGMGITSINNATFTTATLGATETPILGIWNPNTSTVNAVILQASLSLVITALQATGPGGFVWATSTGNTAISTGTLGFNSKTLASSGGQVKGFAASPALTGLTNNMAVAFGSSLNGGSTYDVAELATAAGFQTNQPGAVENFDGSLIIPPGGVLALLAQVTPVAHSATGCLTWEEVPI